MLLFTFIIIFFINEIDCFRSAILSSKKFSSNCLSPLCAIDPKEAAKAEQYKIQQEILARRKKKGAMKEYFESVEQRRKENWKDATKNNWREEKNEVDPIDKWRKALKDGDVKGVGYEPEPPKSSSLFGVNIIIPINPIGIPKYDEGERFDLRLPYAEVRFIY